MKEIGCIIEEKSTQKRRWLFWLIALVALSPMLFKAVGLQERFSSPICILFDFALLCLCYQVIGYKKEFKRFYLLFAVNIASLMITLTVYGGIGVALVHLNSLLLVYLFNELEFSKAECAALHFVMWITLFGWMLLIDTSDVYFAVMWEPNGMDVNPCTFGILSLASYYHVYRCIQLLFSAGKKRTQALHFISFVLAFYFVSLSNCRASLLALMAFGLANIFNGYIIKHYKKILLGMLFLSFLFPIAYLLLYNISGGFDFFGKNFFTGRQKLWESVFQLIGKNPIFGSGAQADIAYGDIFYDEPHNLFLGLWKSIGLLPVASLIIVLLSGKNVRKNDTYSAAKIMFLSCLIVSTVETVLNGSEYYLFFFTLLITPAENKDFYSRGNEYQLTHTPLYKE